MPLLSTTQRRNLKSYKYSGIDHSLFSRYVLQPYWNRLVTLFPLWFAPNLITLSGFGFMMFSLALLMYYSPDLVTPCPRWVYFVWAICLFAYQSLDAIDGKQARRTGSSSPLGELFDHGCDALNTVLVTILGASALNLHQSWSLVFSLISTLTNFYLSTWEEYHTGILYLSPCSGPVEGIMIGIAIFITAGLHGPAFFENSYKSIIPLAIKNNSTLAPLIQFVPDMALNNFMISVGVSFVIFNTILGGINVRSKMTANVPGWVPLFRFTPFAIWAAMLISWGMASPYVLLNHGLALCLLFGIVHGYQVGQIIIGHLTKSGFPHLTFLQSVLLPLGLGVTALSSLHNSNTLLPLISAHVPSPYATRLHILALEILDLANKVLRILCRALDVELRLDVAVVYVLLAVAIVWYLVWALRIIGEICEVFDINCLSIKAKKEIKTNGETKKGANKNGEGKKGRK